tara:strand:+ start:28 stop:1011 length:984 start_codon:yes stop_codon:yes gene_type:complete
MNKRLILDLFRLPSRSRHESLIQEYIIKYLKDNNILFKQDENGNIFNISKKNTPLLSAHMDTVQDSVDVKLTEFIKIRNECILSGYGVIGGDDKCGIYIILELLKSRQVNFVFTTCEEVGGLGMEYFVKNNNLSHIPYGLVLDRRGNSDILCMKNDYGVEELDTMLEAIGKVFGYESALGLWSDADILSGKISCANLSVGYYNPHDKMEFVRLDELEKAKDFTWAIIKNIDKKFKSPNKTITVYGKYGRRGTEWDEYSHYGTDYYDWDCELCGVTDYYTSYIKAIEKNVCSDCLQNLHSEIHETNEVDEDEEIENLALLADFSKDEV